MLIHLAGFVSPWFVPLSDERHPKNDPGTHRNRLFEHSEKQSYNPTKDHGVKRSLGIQTEECRRLIAMLNGQNKNTHIQPLIEPSRRGAARSPIVC